MANINFDDFLNKELKNDDFKSGYLAEKTILESALVVYNARQKAGLTQRELAELSHVPQSTIARIERVNNTNIETMSKIAFALNQELTISIGQFHHQYITITALLIVVQECCLLLCRNILMTTELTPTQVEELEQALKDKTNAPHH